MRDTVRRRIQKDLQTIMGNRQYLAVVFVIGDDGTLQMIRETNAFPVVEFNPVLQLLRDDLNQEVIKINEQENKENKAAS